MIRSNERRMEDSERCLSDEWENRRRGGDILTIHYPERFGDYVLFVVYFFCFLEAM